MIGEVLERAIDTKLVGYVPIAAFNDLEGRLSRLEEENKRLKDGVVNYKREIFTIKELADILFIDPATVRKNYIATGKIQATKNGKQWEVGRIEYMRVMDVVKTRGLSYL